MYPRIPTRGKGTRFNPSLRRSLNEEARQRCGHPNNGRVPPIQLSGESEASADATHDLGHELQRKLSDAQMNRISCNVRRSGVRTLGS